MDFKRSVQNFCNRERITQEYFCHRLGCTPSELRYAGNWPRIAQDAWVAFGAKLEGYVPRSPREERAWAERMLPWIRKFPVEYAEKLVESGDGFSDAAKAEIANVRDLIEKLYEKVMAAYTEVDLELLDEAYDIEESIDVATDMMADEHIKRLANGQCNASVGAEYLSLASNAERVADHFINVGKTIREILPASKMQAFKGQ